MIDLKCNCEPESTRRARLLIERMGQSEGRNNEYRRLVKELCYRRHWECSPPTAKGIWVSSMAFGGNTINRVGWEGEAPSTSVYDTTEVTNFALSLQSNDFPRVMVKLCSSRPALVRLVVRGQSTKNHRLGRHLGWLGYAMGGS